MTIERSWCDAPTSRALPITRDRKNAMKRFTKARTATVAVASGIALVMAGGVAYAYWTTNGTGVAQATAGNALGVVAGVTPLSPASLLYPNGSVPAVVTVRNPNSFPVKITLVTTANQAIGTATVDATHFAAGCTASNSQVALVGGSSGAVSITVNPDADSVAIPVGTMTMGLSPDDKCQGASFSWQGASAASPSPVTVTAAAG